MPTNRQLLRRLDKGLEELQEFLQTSEDRLSYELSDILYAIGALRDQVSSLENQVPLAVRAELEAFDDRKALGRLGQAVLQDRAFEKLSDPSYLMHRRWQVFVRVWMKVSSLEKYRESDEWLDKDDLLHSLRLSGFLMEQAAFMLDYVVEQGFALRRGTNPLQLRWNFEAPNTKTFIGSLGFNWNV